jgi:hypothetical protein
MLRTLKIAGVALLIAVLYELFALYTASERFVAADRNAINSVSYASLENVRSACEKMSPLSHVDGLLDGNFLVPAYLGGSYFYKSYCYQQLAIRRIDATLCEQVIRRPTLLGHDAGISAASCRRRVAQAAQARLDSEKTALAHSAAIAGAAKIATTEVKRAGPNSWLISVLTKGARAGEYEFAITTARHDFRETDTLGLIYRETAYLAEGDNHLLWTVTRDQLFQSLDAGSRPGGVYSLSVSLTYLKPADSQFPFERIDTGVGNAYVDDRK